MEIFKVIYAHGVHSGGGLTLLKEVFSAVEGDSSYLFMLDIRCHQHASQYNLINIKYFPPGFLGRLRSEIKLKKSQDKVKAVLSFNSIPFFLSIKKHTTIFLQNVNLVSASPPSSFTECVKHVLFKHLATGVDQFIVQTRSMYDSLVLITGSPCRISTLLDPVMLNYLNQNNSASSVFPQRRRRFVYVADSSPHKNHAKLLQAWQLLHDTFTNLNIELVVTLPLNLGGVWDELSSKFDVQQLGVVNEGVVSRERIFEIYRSCDALIFPSLSESFGLPLLEASASNLDIIASELDYVRDVVCPVEVFDPNSSVSIARSIARYLELPWPESVRPISAIELLNEVFYE